MGYIVLLVIETLTDFNVRHTQFDTFYYLYDIYIIYIKIYLYFIYIFYSVLVSQFG